MKRKRQQQHWLLYPKSNRKNTTRQPFVDTADGAGALTNEVSFDYLQIAFEVLQSLTIDTRMKRFIGNLLLDPGVMLARRNYIAIVTWPRVWHGIFQQFQLDLPRERLIWQNQLWQGDDPYTLLQEFEGTVGPIWARWLCAFATQSPMADVFTTVWKAYQHQYGPEVYICQDSSPLEIRIDSTPSSLSVIFIKSFRLLPGGGLIDTRYHLDLYPVQQARLSWAPQAVSNASSK